MKLFLLIIKNLGRNPVRTLLTALGTVVLVVVLTGVWSMLSFIDATTREKSKNFKAVVTERWQFPSQMPFAYAQTLTEGAARDPGDARPTDNMTWQFYGGTLDPAKRTRESSLFAFALEPQKLRTMMDELDELPAGPAAELQQAIDRMKENRQGIILGESRLAAINKRVGDRFTLYGINYRGIDLEVEVVGTFPPGRYDNSAAINRDYLNAALDAFPRTHEGEPHPLAAKSLNLVWLRVDDRQTFDKIAQQIMSSPDYASPAVKIETASSGVSTFLEAYRDLIWGMRWLLAPAALATLSLVIANSISISVRERRTELAVLKVLGFRPWQIMLLVLGEGVLIGSAAGMATALAMWFIVNQWIGGLKFPIAFFAAFLIPDMAIVWGTAAGALTALAGSLIPAWQACRVKVTDVFARVA